MNVNIPFECSIGNKLLIQFAELKCSPFYLLTADFVFPNILLYKLRRRLQIYDN